MTSAETTKLKRGITIVFITNVINLVVNLLKNFVLPKYLSIESYADIKLYQLYISYAGLAALGYIDGMHLRFGGKDFKTIDKEQLGRNLSSFRIFQIIVSLLLSSIGIVLSDFVFIAMGVSICALNIAGYYKSLFQATGEFSAYSRIMNISSVSLFAISMILLFVCNIQDSRFYIVAYVIIYYCVWLFLDIVMQRKHAIKKLTFFSIHECKETIQGGWALMLGTFISTFMTGLDRWCVKISMDTYSFALYAFAASVVGFLVYAISPISITLYNYFCKSQESINYKQIREMILVFVTCIIAGAYPIKFVLEHYLTKYFFAKQVIFVLFAGQVLYGFVKCYYVNLYKAQKRQKEYFLGILLVAVSGVFFNIILFLLYREMVSFSVGTLLAGVLWLVICSKHFKTTRNTISEVIYMTILVIVFIASGFFLESYIGFAVYILTWIVLSILFMKQSFVSAIKLVTDLRKKKSGVS